MFIAPYFTTHSADSFSFSREQASHFAKRFANDFNPIHDEDSKLFCVPGDLLFSRVLCERGISTSLKVVFSGMVGDGVRLALKSAGANRFQLKDDNGRQYLELEESGSCRITNAATIEQLIRNYVALSGESFPNLLVPLMKEYGVMVNPSRPLVIYESMSIDLQTTQLANPVLEISGSALTVSGRRGNVALNFVFKDQDRLVGTGRKTIVLGNLRQYAQDAIDALIENYNRRRENFAA